MVFKATGPLSWEIGVKDYWRKKEEVETAGKDEFVGLFCFDFKLGETAVDRYKSPVKQSITSLTTTRKDIVYAEGEDRDGAHNWETRREFVKAVMMMMRAVAVTNDGQNTTRRVKNNSCGKQWLV